MGFLTRLAFANLHKKQSVFACIASCTSNVRHTRSMDTHANPEGSIPGTGTKVVC